MERIGKQISPKIILSEFKRISTKTVVSSGANFLLITKSMVLAFVNGVMARRTSDNGKIIKFKAMEY